MKRITLLFLTLIFALSAVSCRNVPLTNNETNTTETTREDIPDYLSDEFRFNDYNEYKEFLKNEEWLPLIEYEKISFLGQFDYYAAAVNPNGDCTYGILTPQKRMHLTIYKHGNYYPKEDFSLEAPTLAVEYSDMRNAPEAGIEKLCLNHEIIYSYSSYDGFINSVLWISNGIIFWLRMDEGLYDYPNDGSLVSRLLNKYTALEAKAEFEAMVFGEE